MTQPASTFVSQAMATVMNAPTAPILPENAAARFISESAFKTFNEPDLERVLGAAGRFAYSINRTAPHWLTLAGKSGIGKTMLAKEIFDYFVKYRCWDTRTSADGKRTVGNGRHWCNWRRFCSDLRGGAYGLTDDLCDEWFVVLDDIATERDPTGFIASALDRIIHERQHKWTVITVNLSLAEIAEKLDARIADRMLRHGSIFLEYKTRSHALREQI